MAASKRKQVVQKESPKGKSIEQSKNPDSYYSEHPTWSFSACDTEIWGFTQDSVGEIFWTEVLPFLKNLEAKTWSDILIGAKKSHHSVDVNKLNAEAQKRLVERYIEQDSLISLRLNGTHRLYGYIIGCAFHILWFDMNHGDNDSCVCRSYKKHT